MLTRACAACVALASTTFACQRILGFDEDNLTVLDGGSPPLDAMPESGDHDSGPPPCAPRGNGYCEALCPVPDFCDDFESLDSPVVRWEAGTGVQNPILTNDGSVGVELDEWDAAPPNRVLVGRVDSHGTASSGAILVDNVPVAPGRTPRGARLLFRLRPAVFEPSVTTQPRYKTVSFGGIGSASIAEGVSVTMVDEGKGRVSIGVFYTRGQTLIKEVDRLIVIQENPLGNFQRNWFPIELMVGPRDVITAYTDNMCTKLEDGGVAPDEDSIVYVRVGPLPPQCAALPSGLNQRGKWQGGAFVVAGAAGSNHVRAVTVVDDIAMSFLD